MRSAALLLAAALAALAIESAGAPAPSPPPSVRDAEEGAAVRRPLSRQRAAPAAQAARRLKGFSGGGEGGSSRTAGTSTFGGSSDGGSGKNIYIAVFGIIGLLFCCLLKKLRKADEQLNDEGAPVFLGNGDGAEKYYCGRMLGTDKIPGSDGWCGPNGGPQCQSCSRFRGAEETNKEVVNGAQETNKEVTVEVVNLAEEINMEVTIDF